MTAARLRLLEPLLPALTIALLLASMLGRLTCDAELEWMEGAMLDVVAGLGEGQPLYSEPSLEGSSFVYPPLHYGIAWLSTQLFGLGFPALRIPSVLATVAILVLLFELGRRSSGRAAEGLLCAGLFAATYECTGRWMDLGRVDTLQIAFVLGTVWLLQRRSNLRRDLAAGLLLALAFACKQTSLVMLAPLLAWLLIRERVRAIRVGISFAIPSAVAHFVLQSATDGWYGFYVYEVPAAHPWHPDSWLEFWSGDLLLGLPLTFAAAVAASILAKSTERRALPWLLLGALVASYLSRLHWGGWKNVLLPLCAIAAIAAPALLAEARARRWPRAIPLLLAIALQAQLLLGLPRPWDAIPGPEHEERWQQITAELRSLAAPILLPDHGTVLRRAGHAPCVHSVAIWDLLLTLPELRGESTSGPPKRVHDVARRFLFDAREKLSNAHFAHIVLGAPNLDELDGRIPGASWRELYRWRLRPLFTAQGDTGAPFAGAPDSPTYPAFVLERKD